MTLRLNDWKITTKLQVLLWSMAMIIAVVGGIGYWAMGRTGAAIDEIGTNRLPSVENLLVLKANSTLIKSSQRTLMLFGLEPAAHKRQYENIEKAMDACDRAWKVYEPLPQMPEEAKLCGEFLPVWKQWQSDSRKFVELARQVDAFDLGDPHELVGVLEACRADHHQLRGNVMEFVYQGKAWEGGTDHLTCRLGKWLTSFKTSNPEVRRLLQEIEAPHRALHQGVAKIKELAAAGKKDEVQEAFNKDFLTPQRETVAILEKIRCQGEIADKAMDRCYEQTMVTCRANLVKAEGLLDQIIKINSDLAAAEVRRGQTTASTAEWILLVVSIVGAALGICIGQLIARSITRPIGEAIRHLRDLAGGEGDLTKRLRVSSRDEIGEMATCFNTFVEKLHGIISRLAQNTVALSGSSQELAATASQLASGAEETTSQSATVAAAAEQMSTNMSGVAAASEQMSANVKVVASAVEQLTASISEVARSAEQAASVAGNAAQLANDSNARIGELGSAADEIGKVIEVIQDIAEQTNLLALNATIEAARAGEAGKGFAVVATEVKELARQTAGATEDIRKRIEGIQRSTGQAVGSIGDIGEVIKQVNELSRTIASAVEEQSITTKEIARNVAQSATAAHTVAKGVSESATASQEISRNITGVDEAAKQTAQGAAQTQTAGRDLSQMAEQFQSLVGQFKLSDDSHANNHSKGSLVRV